VNYKWTRQAVDELISKLARCALRKEEWTHEAHLVAGFWYTYLLGSAHSLEEMRLRIRRHNESVGTPNTDDSGYHETITRLYLRGIENELAKVHGQDLESSLASLLDSEVADRAWPLRFYSRDRLFSVAARRTWVEPDLLHVDCFATEQAAGAARKF
jgi:hypothetical protein